MTKSRDAFRTISEVAEWLDVPTHVLRFWESRFSQIKPVKRAGGRRYYRPADMQLIGGIKTLLHDDGLTIRGVQKILREEGLKHVAGFSKPLHSDDASALEAVPATKAPKAAEPTPVTPSGPARSTYDAEPQPVTPTDENAIDTPQPDMFAEQADETVTIPETPDVPATDSPDDGNDFPQTPGLAARLLTANKSALVAHRAILQTARDRLAALRPRLDD